MPRERDECNARYDRQPELAIAALLQMLVRYPMVRCGPMADSIAAHLDVVAADERIPGAVRSAARNVRGEWRAMIEMREIIERQQHPLG